MKSILASVLSMMGGLGLGAGGLFTPQVSALSSPVYRHATLGRRSRTPGKPGKPGDKLARKAYEHRIGITTIR